MSPVVLTELVLLSFRYLMEAQKLDSAKVLIDGSKTGNFTRFLNHSCNPNCEVEKWYVCAVLCASGGGIVCLLLVIRFVDGKPVQKIVARKNIKQGEEMTYSYKVQCFPVFSWTSFPHLALRPHVAGQIRSLPVLRLCDPSVRNDSVLCFWLNTGAGRGGRGAGRSTGAVGASHGRAETAGGAEGRAKRRARDHWPREEHSVGKRQRKEQRGDHRRRDGAQGRSTEAGTDGERSGEEQQWRREEHSGGKRQRKEQRGGHRRREEQGGATEEAGGAQRRAQTARGAGRSNRGGGTSTGAGRGAREEQRGGREEGRAEAAGGAQGRAQEAGAAEGSMQRWPEERPVAVTGGGSKSVVGENHKGGHRRRDEAA